MEGRTLGHTLAALNFLRPGLEACGADFYWTVSRHGNLLGLRSGGRNGSMWV